MGKIVADCRGGHAHIEGDGPDWQRPLVSPTQKNKIQKNHLNRRTYPAARAPHLVHLNKALQPRVHRPLHTLASQLHIRIELHWGEAAHRLEQRRVMVPTNSSIILATPNLSLGPTRTKERNSPTRASTSAGRSRSDEGLEQGAGKMVNVGEGGARSALRLQKGVNQHEAPSNVVDGGARRTSVGIVVTHVGRMAGAVNDQRRGGQRRLGDGGGKARARSPRPPGPKKVLVTPAQFGINCTICTDEHWRSRTVVALRHGKLCTSEKCLLLLWRPKLTAR